MYQDGSVSENVKCTDKSIVNVAYNNEWGHFFIWRNSMRTTNWDPHGLRVGKHSSLSRENEILSKFFKTHNSIINWINCFYNWTEAVGKVKY